MMQSKTSGLASFGGYTLDLRTGELRRGATPLKLQPQPAKVLAVLVSRAGELVTRQELARQVWDSDTFVDFEQGLNYAIRQIRAALDDDAEHPRFLERVPKRGYRFVATVAELPDAPAINPQELPGSTSRTSYKVMGLAVLCCVALGYWLLSSKSVPTVSKSVQLTRDGRPKTLFGTDGSRLYIDLGIYDVQGIAQVAAVGGPTIQIPTPSPGMTGISISRDGSELLVADVHGNIEMGQLWSLPIPGGSPRRLGQAAGQTGAWSPDGKLLAYGTERSLFLAKADGSEPRLLATVQNPIFSISWSPDGTYLRFDTWQVDVTRATLWEIHADGSGLHPILPGWNNPPNECCGKWTADGKYFVFISNDQLWALPRKSGFLRTNPKPIQLTFGPMYVHSPLPSSDGKKIFVVGRVLRGELVKFDHKTAKFERFLGGISAEYLDFTQDGKRVTYVAYPEGTLWRSNSDGSQRLQLTYPPMYAMLPRWSPDGQSILFYDLGSDKPTRIYMVSAEGGPPRPLLPNDNSHQSDPNWSPDGNQVVFGGNANDASGSIRILNLADSQVTTVPGSQSFYGPRWSPDGRYLVASNSDGKKLMLFDFQTGEWDDLSDGAGGWPNWSKDSKYVYVWAGGAESAVFRIRISDRKQEKVADLKDFALAGRYDSALALAPDESPLLLRDMGSQDVYALDWETP